MTEADGIPAPAAPTAYDLVDYPGHAFPDTHPGRLAAIGVLHGMTPAPVERCRVLELGCGDGGNLVPMAYQLPQARFLGIDLAATAIARGNSLATTLQLGNVELRALDLCALPPELGEFDYIIAHGVYSWVPPHVREALLAACGTLLAPQGIAFISYLALPGTHVRNVLRDFLLRYAGPPDDPARLVARARQLVATVGGGPVPHDPFQRALHGLAREVQELDDGVLYHDWLTAINAPARITDFVADAARHGLAFLGEAEYFAMCWRQDPTLGAAYDFIAAAEAQDVLLKEQVLDDLRCRRFRQTLLRRAEAPWSPPSADRVLRLAASSRLRPVGEVSLGDHADAEFRTPQDNVVRTDHPAAKAALVVLAAAYPRPVWGDELLGSARQAAGRDDPATLAEDTEVVERTLLACASAAQAQLTAWVPSFATTAGERPRASAVARTELQRSRLLTTLCHMNVSVEDPIGLALLRLLDGSRTRAELVAELKRLIELGEIPPPPDGTEGAGLEEQLADGLERSLAGLAGMALLEA